jgi:putative membrane protein
MTENCEQTSTPQEPPKPPGGIDPRDPRVLMAAERTLLAWIRTGLAMMGFGFVVARFGLFLREIAATTGREVSGGRSPSLWIGVALVLAGVWVLLVSAFHHYRYIRAINAGRYVSPPAALFGLTVSLALVLLGVAMAWYLLVLA